MDKVIEFVTDFRDGILGGRPSRGMCAAVCFPLASLLEINFPDYEFELEEGEIEVDYGDVWGHIWIRVGEMIIDPTADQFPEPDGTQMPPIYYGLRPEWYLELRD